MKSPFDRPASLRFDSGSLQVRLEKLGIRQFDWRDPYHLAVTLPWPQFFATILAIYLAVNFLFALAYDAVAGSIANVHSLADAFFFSVETLATVGYGTMVPATRYGHVVSTVEIFFGMALTAAMTGVVFVRFSKPRARIIYADKALVTERNGERMFMIRIGNGRVNALMESTARIVILVAEMAPDGQMLRRAHDLKLERSELPFFPLTWTLMHRLTPDSELAKLITGTRVHRDVRMFLSITARDPSLGAQVFDMQAYGADDIVFGMRYVEAVTWDGRDRSVADMRKISLVEPDPDAPEGTSPE